MTHEPSAEWLALKAERDGKTVWHEEWTMDAWGDARGTAMARLVSVPVSLAVDSVLSGELGAGVHAAPHDPKLIGKWMGQIKGPAQYLERVDHLA